MGHSLFVLAAGLLLGQAQDIPIVPAAPPQAACTKQPPATGLVQTGSWNSSGWTRSTSQQVPEKRSFLSRIFGSRSSRSAPVEVMQGVAVEPAKQARRITLSEPPLLDAQAKSAPAQAPAANGPFHSTNLQVPPRTTPDGKLPAHVLNKLGHDENYGWVTGRLESENGAWFIRYAAPEMADRYGGRMILDGAIDTARFHNSDLVTVWGSVQRGLSLSTYRIQTMELLDRQP